MTIPLPPKLQSLPARLPIDGAVRIELEDGVLIFRASSFVQTRIETLLLKLQTSVLNPDEEQELDRYEEIDNYLSYLNRVVHNLSQIQYEFRGSSGRYGLSERF